MNTDDSMPPMSRMERGLAHARQAEYAAALADLLWCFEVGPESDPAFGPVRRSFLLSYIAELGGAYVPALAALRERRDRLENSLYSGAATEDEALDLAALNRVLNDVSRTVAAYENVKLTGPERIRAALFSELVAALVEAKRYDEVVDGAENVPLIVDERLQQTLEHLKMLAALASDDADAARGLAREVIEESCQYYEALVAVGRFAEGDSVANAVLAFEQSSDAFVAIVAHGARAGAFSIAKAMLRRGLESLPEADAEQLRVAVNALHLF